MLFFCIPVSKLLQLYFFINFITESLEIMGMVPTFNGCYAVNNATVCFVNHDEAFVIPYMKEVIEVLQNNGFTENHFYVPFSNWDYPKFEQKAWEDLRREAEES